ncbi:MAG TPA: hypothetical protein VK063_07550, partial [Beutenbergiaceae bacterium]|nr:hypothetical protein [Beutenbergiaceae bacterium]
SDAAISDADVADTTLPQPEHIDTRAHLDPDLAWGHHLLIVGPEVHPDDVEALALSRFAGASRRDSQTIDLLPGAWLTGPWALDDHAREGLGLPEEAGEAYLARSPVQRADPVPEELLGLGGLLDAFAEGTPEGTEAEVVEFMLAAACRLGGALRAGGSGRLLIPDPAEHADLLVHAPVWLEPDALKVVLSELLPGLQVLPDPGPAPLPLRPPAPEGLSKEEEQERAELHARADEIDSAALAGEQIHEGYGAIWRFPDDGVISIQVEPLEHIPTVLLGADWAQDGLLTYAVRWYPTDHGAAMLQLESEPLPPATPPEHARALIEDCAAAIQIAAGGVAADDDGFLVDLGVGPEDEADPEDQAGAAKGEADPEDEAVAPEGGASPQGEADLAGGAGTEGEVAPAAEASPEAEAGPKGGAGPEGGASPGNGASPEGGADDAQQAPGDGAEEDESPASDNAEDDGDKVEEPQANDVDGEGEEGRTP